MKDIKPLEYEEIGKQRIPDGPLEYEDIGANKMHAVDYSTNVPLTCGSDASSIRT